VYRPDQQLRLLRPFANAAQERTRDMPGLVLGVGDMYAEASRRSRELDDLRKHYEAHIAAQDERVRGLDLEIARLNAVLREVWGSLSWRLTKPLRVAMILLRKWRANQRFRGPLRSAALGDETRRSQRRKDPPR
jgi:hypothetical protein